ncbi:MAG: hypothetical protein EUB_01606 [Eubacterium sp.]|uniref:hypothetical protein n=1 Tax=Eubacterium sp. TaxID=142586 RepID=UPI003039E598
MKTIKMTNQEIINHVNNIGGIMDVRLPRKVAYALNKNRKALLKELQTVKEPHQSKRKMGFFV